MCCNKNFTNDQGSFSDPKNMTSRSPALLREPFIFAHFAVRRPSLLLPGFPQNRMPTGQEFEIRAASVGVLFAKSRACVMTHTAPPAVLS